jgi:hypothetical protein
MYYGVGGIQHRRDKFPCGFYSGVTADEAAVPTLVGSRSSTGVGWDSGESLIDD